MTVPAGPGVAIIVPMFDVEPYVADCVRSILDQDLADVEVVLVDDGSTDGTAEVALAAAGQHPAVRLLRKAQGGPGPGSARNAGLDATTAPLVLFCDGDDLLAPGAVAALRQALDTTGAELACGAAEQFPQPRTWPWSEYFVGEEPRAGTIEDFPQLVHNAAVGNKLFRRELLTRGGLRFAEGIHHQDTYVSVPALLDARALAVVPAVVQRYRKRDAADSIMDAHFTRVGNYWDHLQVVEHLAALRPGLPAERVALLDAFLVRSFQGFALRAPEVLATGELAEFHRRAGAVYRDVPLDTVRAWTYAAAHRAAYRALTGSDVREYRRMPERVRRATAHRGSLVLDLPDALEAARDLRVGRSRATLAEASVHEGRLHLALDVALRRGPRPSTAVNAVLFRLTPLESEPTGSSEPIESDGPPARVVLELTPAGEGAGDAEDADDVVSTAPERFHGTVALDGIAGGTYAMSVAFVTRRGQTSCDVTAEASRTASVVGELGPGLSLAPGADGALTLVVGADRDA